MEGDDAIAREADRNEERREGKTVVLGIRTDSKSRELLTWALVNVAVSGDRVIAVHVRRFSSLPAEGSGQCANELELMRKAYDGFCSLIRIELVMKVCGGFSVRRALVRQVNSYCASHLILGESKSSTAFRSSLTSIPKYCAKRLPPGCSVTAVNNGKIVFGKVAVGWFDRKSMSGESFDCLLKTKGQEHSAYDTNKSSQHGGYIISSEGLNCSTGIDLDINSIAVQLLEEKCSVCDTGSCTQSFSKGMVGESLQEPKSDAQISSNTSVAFGLQEPTDAVGFSRPFLWREILAHRRTISMDGSRTSLVQLAKWISGRSSTSSENHSVGKHQRSDTFSACDLHKERKLSPFHLEGTDIQNKIESLQEKYSSSCKLFSYAELKQATCNFSADRLIGKGGSSLVYKGILLDGKEVAIKTLKLSKDSLQQFISEIDVITTLNHKNIISLLGFCLENNYFVLIYDFLSRGSLEENLHGSEERKFALSWYDRYRISIGVAEALNFLHGHGTTEPVIHMDVKSSNILLSDDFVPKLSDFGLARRPTESVSQLPCNSLAGTFGYLAPEYFMFGQISIKTDVYAFGVVLLELLSGRKPINSEGIKGAQSLVMWAKPMLQNGIAQELMDPSVDSQYNVDQMEWVVLAASLCLKRDSQSRPTMHQVLKLLLGDEDSVEWAKSQVDSSANTTTMEDEDLCKFTDIKSGHNVLLLNLDDDDDDDSQSESSKENLSSFTTDGASVEDSLHGRFSRSSSLE